jgi:hypothetical protein
VVVEEEEEEAEEAAEEAEEAEEEAAEAEAGSKSAPTTSFSILRLPPARFPSPASWS